MTWRFFTLTFMLFGRLAAQPFGEAIFAGRVVDAQQQAVKGARVMLVGVSETRTDDDGLFRVSIPSNLTEVQIELERFEVVYPRGGRTPVPKSAATPVVIEVKKMEMSEQEKLIRQLRESVKKLESDKRFKEEEVRQLEKNMQDSIRVYQRMLDESGGRSNQTLDSLQRKITSLLAAQESSLLAKKKEQIYSEVTRNLLTFLDKSKNLRDALTRIDDVFLSQKAHSNFEKQITAYSAARDTLYNHHKAYIESVRLFWNDNEATRKTEDVFNLALVQIHEGIMLPLNKSVVNPVRDFNTGKAARNTASREARSGAEKAVEQLAFPLKNLELKINELSHILTH